MLYVSKYRVGENSTQSYVSEEEEEGENSTQSYLSEEEEEECPPKSGSEEEPEHMRTDVRTIS